MEMIICLIACLIVCGIVGYISYRTGLNKKVKEVEYNNLPLELARTTLLVEIASLEDKRNNLKQEYSEQLELINSASEKAKEEYLTRSTLLAERYSLQEKELQSQFDDLRKELEYLFIADSFSYDEQIEKMQEQLDKLSQTKASAIEAFQREEKMKEEQDLYRIVLSNDEEKDIEILNSIRNKLVKPRVLDMLIWTTFFRDKAKEKLLFILPQKETTGVYKLTNIKNQKVYIGQAVNIYDRIFTHLKHGLHIDCPAGNKLYDAMHKDGIQNFTIELLEECKPEELNEKEKYFISLYNAVDWGYNKTIGNN